MNECMNYLINRCKKKVAFQPGSTRLLGLINCPNTQRILFVFYMKQKKNMND